MELQVRELEQMEASQRLELEDLKKIDPELRVRAARARLKAAEADRDLAEKAVADCVLTAPAAGDDPAAPGGPGGLICTRGPRCRRWCSPRPGRSVVRAEVDQGSLGRVAVGMPAEVQDENRPDWPGLEGPGQDDRPVGRPAAKHRPGAGRIERRPHRRVPDRAGPAGRGPLDRAADAGADCPGRRAGAVGGVRAGSLNRPARRPYNARSRWPAMSSPPARRDRPPGEPTVEGAAVQVKVSCPSRALSEDHQAADPGEGGEAAHLLRPAHLDRGDRGLPQGGRQGGRGARHTPSTSTSSSATARAATVLLALSAAIEKVKQQIKHYKERLQDHRRDPSHGGTDGVRQ